MSGEETSYTTLTGSQQLESWQTELSGLLIGVDPIKWTLSGACASSVLQTAFDTYVNNFEDDLTDAGQLGYMVSTLMEANHHQHVTADTDAATAMHGPR